MHLLDSVPNYVQIRILTRIYGMCVCVCVSWGGGGGGNGITVSLLRQVSPCPLPRGGALVRHLVVEPLSATSWWSPCPPPRGGALVRHLVVEPLSARALVRHLVVEPLSSTSWWSPCPPPRGGALFTAMFSFSVYGRGSLLHCYGFCVVHTGRSPHQYMGTFLCILGQVYM